MESVVTFCHRMGIRHQKIIVKLQLIREYLHELF
ncbi:hypothetical protein KW060_14460 [Pseudemcibacter aquimaris]|nr:hypothetical protein KW060_14460 [Pseudemcibacter aquimaris]